MPSFGTNGVRHDDRAEQLLIARDEHLGSRFSLLAACRRNYYSIVRHPKRASDQDDVAVEIGGDASAWGVGEVGSLGDVAPCLARVSDDSLAQRMLRAQFGRRSGSKKHFGRYPRYRNDPLNIGPAERERTGLVEHHRIDAAERFEVHAAFDDRTETRPIAPRMASGVPAAIPQAPATIMTEIVERMSCVIRKVSAAAPRAK